MRDSPISATAKKIRMRRRNPIEINIHQSIGVGDAAIMMCAPVESEMALGHPSDIEKE
jgi:hypothetical protein